MAHVCYASKVRGRMSIIRTRSCILAQSGKRFSEFNLYDQVVSRAGFCQGSVQLFPGCFLFIQTVLIALLNGALG